MAVRIFLPGDVRRRNDANQLYTLPFTTGTAPKWPDLATLRAAEERKGLLDGDHRADTTLLRKLSCLGSWIVCVGVATATTAVATVVLMLYFALQAQTLTAEARAHFSPIASRLVAATDTMLSDAQSSLSHVNHAAAAGERLATDALPTLLTAINSSAALAQHAEHILRKPTIEVSLGGSG